jgi:hypothetical protein
MESRRIALYVTSWVEHITGWIDDDASLMPTLLDEAQAVADAPSEDT